MHDTVVSRALIAALTAAGLVLAALPGAPAVADDRPGTPRAAGPYDEPVHTFLSAPDLFNADVGDVRGASSFERGSPNSWNRHWAASVDNVFGQLAGFDADSYLVAGDMVNGRWHRDRGNVGTFGPGRTLRQVRQRVARAGDTYYAQWKSFWTDAGVPAWRVHTAVGDHELGDNPWSAGHEQLESYWAYKQAFARHFTRTRQGRQGSRPRYALRPTGTAFHDTAYAHYVAGGRVLLVTVDWFSKEDGAIRTTVHPRQLAWLDRTLAAAPDGTTILVQGHMPVLEPVRRRGGGGPTTRYGESSPFWQLLTRHDVDLYLAGEVHDFTMVQRNGGPVQITHGGYAGGGRTDFVVGDVLDDGSIEIDARTIDVVGRTRDRMWQTGGTMTARLDFAPTSRSVGSLVLDADGRITEASGCLAPYTGPYGVRDDCTRG